MNLYTDINWNHKKKKDERNNYNDINRRKIQKSQLGQLHSNEKGDI